MATAYQSPPVIELPWANEINAVNLPSLDLTCRTGFRKASEQPHEIKAQIPATITRNRILDTVVIGSSLGGWRRYSPFSICGPAQRDVSVQLHGIPSIAKFAALREKHNRQLDQGHSLN
jgi:hypothetical protein